jgi:hypothetical protein
MINIIVFLPCIFNRAEIYFDVQSVGIGLQVKPVIDTDMVEQQEDQKGCEFNSQVKLNIHYCMNKDTQCNQVCQICKLKTLC